MAKTKETVKAVKIPGAISVKKLLNELKKERWDNQTFKVEIRDDFGNRYGAVRIGEERDRLAIYINAE